jgi:hypothetical protein
MGPGGSEIIPAAAGVGGRKETTQYTLLLLRFLSIGLSSTMLLGWNDVFYVFISPARRTHSPPVNFVVADVGFSHASNRTNWPW